MLNEATSLERGVLGREGGQTQTLTMGLEHVCTLD